MQEKMNRHLKISLQELKDSIDVSKLKKSEWNSKKTTNCYAYALGIDIPEEEVLSCGYEPGAISGVPYSLVNQTQFNYRYFIESIKADCEALGLSYALSTPKEEIIGNGWKIALFTTRPIYTHNDVVFSDFHFMRQSDNGIWYHKKGYSGSVCRRDDQFRVIRDPSHCFLNKYLYRECYILSKKK